ETVAKAREGVDCWQSVSSRLEPTSCCASVPPTLARAKANYKTGGRMRDEQSALCVSGGVRTDLAGTGALPRAHRVQLAGRIDHLSRRDRHDRTHTGRVHAARLPTRHP